MKKVLNWTIGSFFRTIGRTIAFLVMGGLIYYLLSYNGIGITDLFFDKVKASENYGQNWFNYYLNGNAMVMKPNSDSFMYMGAPNENSNSNNICFNSTCANDSNNINVQGFDTITFGIGFRQMDTGEFTCSIDGQLVQYNNSLTYDGIGGNYYNYIMKYTDLDCYSTNGATIGISAEWNQGYLTPCVINNYVKTDNQRDVYLTVSCPVVKNQTYLRKLNIQSIYATSIYISPYIMKSKDSTQQIIDNQDQNTQQIIEQQQNSTEQILDSNTTEAEEEATGFFDDFEAPDIGGLSSIVTAPLTTIQSLLNSTCTNLQLPLPYVNKTLTLPCMYSIYTEHFGAFFSIYQTIILAIIAYRCIRSIFFDIHGFTNPSDDRIEVMDL